MWLLVLFVLAAAPACATEDSGAWLMWSAGKPIGAKVDTALRAEVWLDEDMSRFHFFLLQPSIAWHAHRHLDLGGMFAFARSKNARDEFLTEYRAGPEVNPRAIWGPVLLYCRNRFEFRSPDPATDRYRGRFIVKSQRKLTSLQLQPYVWDEWFYDFRLDRYNGNWLSGGVAFPIDTRTTVALSYVRRGALRSIGGWTFTNTASFEFNLQFK